MWRDVLTWSGPVLEVGVLAGLIVRRRIPRARLLPVLLVAFLLSDVALYVFPQARNWSFWFAKEAVHALLAFALWVEVTVRIFAPFPGARRTLVPGLAGVVVMAVVLALTLPLETRALAAVPRFLAALAFLYGGVYGVMRIHTIPADPLHKAILLGLAPCLLFNAVSWGRVDSAAAFLITDVANSALFLLVLLVLLAAAWRVETPPAARPSLVKRIWPWW